MVSLYTYCIHQGYKYKYSKTPWKVHQIPMTKIFKYLSLLMSFVRDYHAPITIQHFLLLNTIRTGIYSTYE